MDEDIDIEPKHVPDAKELPAEPHNNNDYGWNHKLESSAKEIGEMSGTYKLMHLSAARKNQRTGNIYTNIGIFLGPLGSVVEAIDIALNPPDNLVLPIVGIVLGFVSMLVVSKIKMGNFAAITSAHQETAARYTSLESTIRRQLSLYRPDRVSAKEYMDFIATSYQDLIMAAPLIPKTVYRRYKRRAKRTGLSLPLFYSKTIEIDLEYQKNKIHELTATEEIDVNEGQPRTNGSEDSPDLENQLHRADANSSLCGKTRVKRGSVLSRFPDLEKYGDHMLRYEMARFNKNL